MTVLISGVSKRTGKVIMASDSRATRGNGECSKVRKIYKDGEFTISITGYLHTFQFIKSKLRFPSAKEIEEHDIKIDKDFMAAFVRPVLSQLSKEINHTDFENGACMIGYKDRVFLVHFYGGIYECKDDGFITSGCGEINAAPYIDCLKEKEKDSEKIIVEAMKYTIENNAFCGYPICITTTDSNKMKVIDKRGRVTIETLEGENNYVG